MSREFDIDRKSSELTGKYMNAALPPDDEKRLFREYRHLQARRSALMARPRPAARAIGDADSKIRGILARHAAAPTAEEKGRIAYNDLYYAMRERAEALTGRPRKARKSRRGISLPSLET